MPGPMEPSPAMVGLSLGSPEAEPGVDVCVVFLGADSRGSSVYRGEYNRQVGESVQGAVTPLLLLEWRRRKGV